MQRVVVVFVFVFVFVAVVVAGCGEGLNDAVELDQDLRAPSNVTATGTSTTSIALSWTDKTQNESGFVVEVRGPAATSYSRIARLAANTTRYSHTGLVAGTTYSYRVAGLDRSGALSSWSYASTKTQGTSTTTTPTPTPTTTPGPRVIPVYVTATDSTDADITADTRTMAAIVAGVRGWYSQQMGSTYQNKTYKYDTVKVLRGHYTKAQWEDFGKNGFLYPDGRRTAAGGGCAMWYGARYEMIDRGLLAAAGLPAAGSPDVIYYAWMGGGSNGSCGSAGFGASERKILTDARVNCPTGRTAGGSATGGTANCQLVGAFAHELGHALNLPHCSDRATCTGRSIMDYWWEYDTAGGATLSSQDRTDLNGSRFMLLP